MHRDASDVMEPAQPIDESALPTMDPASLEAQEPESMALEQCCTDALTRLFAGANVASAPAECVAGVLEGDYVCVVGLRGPRLAAIAVMLEPSALRRLVMALRRCVSQLDVDVSGLEGNAERDTLVYGLGRALARSFVRVYEPGEYTILHPVVLSGKTMRTEWSFEYSWARTVTLSGCEFDVVVGFDLADDAVGNDAARRAVLSDIAARFAPPSTEEDEEVV